MSNQTEQYIIVDGRETLLLSFSRNAITYGFMLLCIWASQGSVWWTFVTGVLFLMSIAGRMAVLAKENYHCFSTLAEAKGWIEREEARNTESTADVSR